MGTSNSLKRPTPATFYEYTFLVRDRHPGGTQEIEIKVQATSYMEAEKNLPLHLPPQINQDRKWNLRSAEPSRFHRDAIPVPYPVDRPYPVYPTGPGMPGTRTVMSYV